MGFYKHVFNLHLSIVGNVSHLSSVCHEGSLWAPLAAREQDEEGPKHQEWEEHHEQIRTPTKVCTQQYHLKQVMSLIQPAAEAISLYLIRPLFTNSYECNIKAPASADARL